MPMRHVTCRQHKPARKCLRLCTRQPLWIAFLLACFCYPLTTTFTQAFATRTHHQHQQQQQQGRAIAPIRERLRTLCLYESPKKDEGAAVVKVDLKTRKEQTERRVVEESNRLIVQGGDPLAIIGTQALLIPIALVLSLVLQTPNFGFGPDIDFSLDQLLLGCVFTVPLAILAAALGVIEDKVPALQEVTKATQRAVISFLGSQFRPLPSTLAAIGIGLAAGFGEELLFRGVFQYGLVDQLDLPLALGIFITSILFGLVHAVTPTYVLLATAASVYFGSLYAAYSNLAIPIVTHAVYDVGALMYAHWEIGRLTPDELRALLTPRKPEEQPTKR